MKYLLLSILLLPQVNLMAQSSFFSGKIIYEYKFLDPESGKDITETMAATYGEEQHYFIHFDSYKSFDEKGNFGQLYTGRDNKYFYPNPNTNDIMVMDASYQTSEIISISHTEETETIFGNICNQLIIETTSDETVYFFSDEIRVDASKFTGHKLGDWGEFLKASNGALPLKYVVKNENYLWISTAIEVQKLDLTTKDFDPELLFQ